MCCKVMEYKWQEFMEDVVIECILCEKWKMIDSLVHIDFCFSGSVKSFDNVTSVLSNSYWQRRKYLNTLRKKKLVYHYFLKKAWLWKMCVNFEAHFKTFLIFFSVSCFWVQCDYWLWDKQTITKQHSLKNRFYL